MLLCSFIVCFDLPQLQESAAISFPSLSEQEYFDWLLVGVSEKFGKMDDTVEEGEEETEMELVD